MRRHVADECGMSTEACWSRSRSRLPLLLLVFTGIFDFGIAYYNQLTLTQAVGAGAQYLQQIRTSTTDPCADTLTAIRMRRRR